MRRRDFITLLGGAAAWPLPGIAQQPKPVIGFLSGVWANAVTEFTGIFQQTLRQAGYAIGQNVDIEYRWAEGQFDRLPAMAADLVRRQVSVIVAVGGDQSVVAAKAATASVPIVFTLGADPVKLGLVTSLNRPGGNMTGVTQFTTSPEPKRFELLREAVPNTNIVGMIVNPNRPGADVQVREVEAGARAVGQQVIIVKASNDGEIDMAFETLAQQRATLFWSHRMPSFFRSVNGSSH